MKYKFNDDTLIHGLGFNPMKLEGILKHGIITENYAKNNNIPYSRNYNFTLTKEMLDKVGNWNVNDQLENANKNNIFLVRYLYVSDDPLSAYNMYVKNGISMIVEDIPYIYDKSIELIKRSDEVIVKDYIPKDNIKSIMIPVEYKDKKLNEVDMLPDNILNYRLIKEGVTNLLAYLQSYGYNAGLQELSFLLKNLKIAYLGVNSLDKNNPDYSDAIADYKEIICEINGFLSECVYECFSNMLGCDATVFDMVSYINCKYNNKDITYLEGKGKTK